MEIITAIWELVVSGAPNALNAVLLGAVFYLLWEKREVRKIIDEQNKTINTIHTEYVESITKMIVKSLGGTEKDNWSTQRNGAGKCSTNMMTKVDW